MFHVYLTHYLCTNINELHKNINVVCNLTKKDIAALNISKEPIRLISNYRSELPLKPRVWHTVIKIYTATTELCLRTLQDIVLALLICIHKILGSSPCPDSGSPERYIS